MGDLRIAGSELRIIVITGENSVYPMARLYIDNIRWEQILSSDMRAQFVRKTFVFIIIFTTNRKSVITGMENSHYQ